MTKEEFLERFDKVHTLKEWVELREQMPDGMFAEKDFGIPNPNMENDRFDFDLPDLPSEEFITII